MATLPQVTADLRAGAAGVTAAEVSLSSAGAYAYELLSAVQAMELDLVATRFSELIARLDALTDQVSGLRQSLEAALTTVTALGGSSAPAAPRSFTPSPRPGRVTGSTGRLKPQERQVVDYLTEHDAEVEILFENHREHGVKNPDARVRWSEREPWVVTEFKTLDSGTSTAVKNNIIAAAKQVAVRGGGDVVIDTRGVDIDLTTLERGCARARGQASKFGQPMPHRIHVILPDGQLITLGQGPSA